MKNNPHTGSSFDEFLKEEGLYEEVTARALKRIVALQIKEAMKEKHLSKNKMAQAMKTSRAALDRLLDPGSHSVTLLTIAKAAGILGKRVKISLA